MENGVLFQTFHWHASGDGGFWDELAARAKSLRDAGFTALWLPPMGKGAGGTDDRGYGAYDLFDLGEFPAKNDIRTKYGTRDQLLAALAALRNAGLQTYADIVFNHKDGGDEPTERVWGQPVDGNNRNQPVGDWENFDAYTRFTFPARGGKYSGFIWNAGCFDALTYNATTRNNNKLYRLKDKSFSTDVSHEHGNFEYLSANDIDMGAADENGFLYVREHLRDYGRWLVDTTRVDGFRLDACKHIRASWFPDWLGHLRDHFSRELFAVGEYWSGDIDQLTRYLDVTDGALSLFDVPLHYRLRDASESGNSYDLRTIFDNTLISRRPERAVTFVDNHDTQPFESLYSWVSPWFKPHAYALILLRKSGYPCVFAGDYDGALYRVGQQNVTLPSHRWLLDRLLLARANHNHGDQHDYFDHPNTIGWVRTGDEAHPGAMAVVLTNGGAGEKWMNTFKPGAHFIDTTGQFPPDFEIVANQDGWAKFLCRDGGASVWLQK